MRMNRFPKGDGKPLTGYRSMFDFVTAGTVSSSAVAAPKVPQIVADEESDKDLPSDVEFADSDAEEAADENPAKRQRKSYKGAFKRKALQLVVALGINNAARKLKVPPGTLSGWKLKLAKARAKRLLEAPANTPGLPVTLEDEIDMLADGRAGNGNRVPAEVEQGMYAWFMHLRQTVCRCELNCLYGVMTID